MEAAKRRIEDSLDGRSIDERYFAIQRSLALAAQACEGWRCANAHDAIADVPTRVHEMK